MPLKCIECGSERLSEVAKPENPDARYKRKRQLVVCKDCGATMRKKSVQKHICKRYEGLDGKNFEKACKNCNTVRGGEGCNYDGTKKGTLLLPSKEPRDRYQFIPKKLTSEFHPRRVEFGPSETRILRQL